jgi:putative GTP pyrophosphokinase
MPDEKDANREVVERYRAMRDLYVAFTDALLHELTLLLRASGGTIADAQVEARTKTVVSFAEKIDRKGKYTDPLRDVTDLTGLRVIVYNPGDIPILGSLIEADFEIDEENSVSRGADIGADRFGYRAEHFVISLKPELYNLAGWARFEGFKAEVQVRTVMQHAWAAVDHRIRYKSSPLPETLQRRLFRLSALLEIADEQFAALQARTTEMSDSYAESVARGDLNVALDGLSLAAFVEESRVDRHWATIALGEGYRQPQVDQMDPATLLETMRDVGVDSLTELQRVLESAAGWGREALARILFHTRDGRAPGDRFADIIAYRDDVLRLLLLFNGRSVTAISRSGFRTDIREGLARAVGESNGQGLGDGL